MSFISGRSDVTISPSTFPRREITKECPHKNEIFDVVMDVVEDLVEEKDFRVSTGLSYLSFSGSHYVFTFSKTVPEERPIRGIVF